MSVVLYSYFRSSCSWRVRIALNLKNINYTYKAVNLLKGEQVKDDYLAVNPMGEVPTLVIDGERFTQSLSIIEYLDEIYPDVNPLLPRSSPKDRAKVRKLTDIIATGVQPVQNFRVLKKHGMERKLDWAQWVINKGFGALELELQLTAGKYCFGDEVTIADLVLVPQVYNAKRFEVNMDKYPTILRIYNALMELDAFKKAAPAQQPDCPEDLKSVA